MILNCQNKKSYQIAIVILVAVLGCIYIVRARHVIYLDTNTDEIGVSVPLLEGVVLEENFFSSDKTEFCIKIRTITWERRYEEDTYLEVRIREKNSDEILDTKKVKLRELPDNAFSNEFFFDGVMFEKDQWYVIEFESNAKKEESSISLMCTKLKNIKNSYGSVNGIERDFDFAMIICE